MLNLFWRQFRALLWKNWIVLSKHPFLTILRCLILPVAYGVFLAYGKVFLHRLNNYGLGEPASIYAIDDQFDGSKSLVWADGTNGASNPSPFQIIARITSNFTSTQLAGVKEVANLSDISASCPQNFNALSSCFAGVGFTDIPSVDAPGTRPVNYTIFSDAGLSSIDVEHHTSDFETRIFPLQWAVDQAIIELQTGIPQQTPLEWPYTNMTNAEQKTAIRLSYIRGVRQIICLAFFVTFIGISYQIPGSVASERTLLLTEHMKAMGLLESARILSWHIGISVTYLPAWIAVSLIWKYLLFLKTSVALVLAVHVLLGLVLASWSYNFCFFGLVLHSSSTAVLFVFSIIFPPSFYIFALKAICGYENHQIPTNAVKGDPDRDILVLPLLIAALVDIFLWPCLALLFERLLYATSGPGRPFSLAFWKRRKTLLDAASLPANVAVSIRNLTKTYKGFRRRSKGAVTAVSNLDLNVPATGIFVMLGSNGGTIVFEGGSPRPPRGSLGIVPQKNVLFPELTCLQALRVWKAVKWSQNSVANEDLEQLLRDCDLGSKINASSATLSGGQRRKLHLAIGLLGGSKVLLVDECTSGVDPLSRRALWKILTTFREDRSIVFTTHFLDEADLLADQIVILTPPGKVLASGSPVALKRDLGDGYTIQVMFPSPDDFEKQDSSLVQEILEKIRAIAPLAFLSTPSPTHVLYHLKTRDSHIVGRVLGMLDGEVHMKRITSYEILGSTIEDIFLELMAENEVKDESSMDTLVPLAKPTLLDLPNGRPVSPLVQAFTIFHKRVLIARRSWLSPLIMIIVAVAGSCIPLVFIAGQQQQCGERFYSSSATPLYLPYSPILHATGPSTSEVIASPPNIISTLGPSTRSLNITNEPNNQTFVNTISENYHNLSLGGISIGLSTGASLVAWEASPPGIRGSSMLNLATNVLYNLALNSSGNARGAPVLIEAYYSTFPKVVSNTLLYLKWLFFFGAAMAVYPAFYALYVSRERLSSVQAMQSSNGLTNPIGLWLGHLMFDMISSVLLSTIIIIIFATVAHQFYGLGFLWLVLVLYGVSAALFAYCLSLMVSSPLAAFAIVAGYQFIIFVLYVSAYLFIFTFGPADKSSHSITIANFAISIVAPVASVGRASLIAANLFSLACSGDDLAGASTLGSINHYGGPIVYLIVYALVLMAILVLVDSGSRALYFLKSRRRRRSDRKRKRELAEESAKTGDSAAVPSHLLRTVDLSKAFRGRRVVDNVNLEVPQDTIFALIGPNGAGKTTTFNIIRGDVLPDSGDVIIRETSVVHNPHSARSALGFCPQFTAIDIQLSVREHLRIYGKLKGLKGGHELNESVDSIMKMTSLDLFADRLACKLSGGNQRKLALAISLLGNPPVILIDEFSTGVDAKMKRDMWQVLRGVSVGKAIVITTHSMEEASALSNKVGILARRMLALGTPESLIARYASYEVHFTCHSRDEVVKARALMAHIPGSRMADDVATRFEVPISSQSDFSLAKLFNVLSSHGNFMEYTVERASLETVFLKVIRENKVGEEDEDPTRSRCRC
ncbi:hypothetical protein M413DRAFT_420628 [Hebeloma cylindrosporum]|uniref:ABC transporter domain-containing protein n=1 Tax=Hebeloma cylindrosporum TaxID=76867 RepID=A0A0C3C1Q4_HEBCY|nr:hypothetical protein M413DRAFT_420628 [Hebeloma cylindrosporum h7]